MLAHFCCSSMHNQSHKKNVSMNLFQKIQQLPLVSKFILNRYAPYRGAGIEIDKIDFNNYHVRVKMPLTRKTRILSAYILVAACIRWSILLYVTADASFGAEISGLG